MHYSWDDTAVHRRETHPAFLSEAMEGKIVDDEEIVRRIFRDDPRKGFEILFKRHYDRLCNHAIRFVVSKDIAEDIVAEVFTAFWHRRLFEQVTTSYRAYLYRAVRYQAYNYLKWELHRSDSLEGVDILMHLPEQNPDEILHYNELHHKIDEVILELPTQSRKAFLMHRMEGKKYGEIAESLGISVSAVERLVSRALSKLRSELKGFWLGLFFIFWI